MFSAEFAFFVLVTLIPQTVFAPRLAQAKRDRLGEIGRLASRYTRRFEERECGDERWIGIYPRLDAAARLP